MTTEKEIAGLFTQGFDCGQVVLASAAERLGLDRSEAYRMTAGFGGGLFRGQTCGAVAGAIIALGMKYGHYEPNTPDRKNQNTAKVLEFQQKFMEKYSSTVCRELLGYDISKPEEMKIILEKGLLLNFCPKVAADAIEILNELL
ncbi:C_GCAxxG_C_C family probable redox protein [Sporobacter termitidis DSM 10068]|uniref:C_GCAxxG_C_C family probable redox protein n=1 Tax=Sporobacter termitidis DSM 10068 TaxID=1123282 RepID=A0A1M5WAE5_9FIRM|nr:C-GCAxxG-C-C family protein [Sporobacter termitidis]SHH84437.1 C_GCAxxG_C_C family probable redox protein [Sporobacter termitidis DSM 10068]